MRFIAGAIGILAAGALFAANWNDLSPGTAGEPDDRYLTRAIRAAYPGFVGQERELSARSARLDREYREQTEIDRQKREDDWAARRAKQEVAAEAAWNSAPASDCRSSGREAKPQLCISLEGPRSRRLGAPVTYRVRWHNLSRDAYIRIWVVNAAPANERWKYLSPTGSITLPVLGRAPHGDERITWDGRSTTCAPADLPMLCDHGQIGTYVLRAAVLTGSDPFHVGWPDRNPIPTRCQLRSQTAPFTLAGSPELDAFEPVREAVEEVLPAIREPRTPPLKLGAWKRTLLSWCSRTQLKWPMAGTVEICFPRSRLDQFGVALRRADISVTSDARLASGIMSRDDAKAHAIAYGIEMAGRRATFPAYPGESDLMRALGRDPETYNGGYQQLRNDARDAGLSYVDVNQPDATFMGEASGSWWLLAFDLRVVKIDGPGGIDLGNVTLRVDHDGHVCRVNPMQKKPGLSGSQPALSSSCLPGSQELIEL